MSTTNREKKVICQWLVFYNWIKSALFEILISYKCFFSKIANKDFIITVLIIQKSILNY